VAFFLSHFVTKTHTANKLMEKNIPANSKNEISDGSRIVTLKRN
jgi:hypothetical protein